MVNPKVPPMHEDFARWYSTVSLGDDQRYLQARWEGISSVIRFADKNTVESLLRLAHQSRQRPVTAVVEKIGEAFKATDPAFDKSGNARELQVLAGVCLEPISKSLEQYQQ